MTLRPIANTGSKCPALAARLPGLDTYRQNHIVERLFEVPDSPVQAIDGVSQLSFESVAHMERSDELMARVGIGGGSAKLMWVSTRRDGAASDGLHQRWLAANRGAGQNIPGACRFVQNFVTDRGHPVAANVPSGDPRSVETISELWFDDSASLHSAVASAAGQRLLHNDPLLSPLGIYLIEEIRIG